MPRTMPKEVKQKTKIRIYIKTKPDHPMRARMNDRGILVSKL